jgi:hypothetical protein
MATQLDHESIRTAVATFGGYGVILVVMFVLLFLVPFALFRFL